MKLDKILLATTNKGKLKEFKHLLKDAEIQILSLQDMPQKIEVVEDRPTFLENAIKKAKEYALFYKVPVIAEDAGLEIDALGGFPGVYSARFFSLKEFGGEEPVQDSTDRANILKVLRLMEGEKNRTARFVSNIVLYIPEEEGFWTEGYLYGEITQSPLGEGGFGYDPIFRPIDSEKTLAQLSPEEKNRISHRGQAVRKLIKVIKQLKNE
ncbi:MAG: RdgB/HAM1 family non-canonical purine NTP pyrophosphatase [Aquificae bacterium]|nr:RdgB/HAM1 family non-canonical purine NTP pyrophosphatase [Aquificota bacterium]